jgi:hypothetical protein
MKKILYLSIILLICFNNVNAYFYAEHKFLGEHAFNQFVQYMDDNVYHDRARLDSNLKNVLGMEWDSVQKVYYYPLLSNSTNRVTYGVLNGLAGDHEENPLLMEEMLIFKYSYLNRIVSLHDEYLDKFVPTAPDADLAGHDFRYALFAVQDFSHFQNYGFPLEYHLKEFDKSHIKDILSPKKIDYVFGELQKTNSVDKYITLHAAAIHIAETAGSMMKSERKEALRLLYYAFLYNGFADHFLEDNFASGHNVVNRGVFSSIINNKSLHDFYNEEGVSCVNMNGETWFQYGDGQLNYTNREWITKDNLSDIYYKEIPENTQRIVDAVFYSILEIWEGFKRGQEANFVSIIDRIPDNKDSLDYFFIDEFKPIKMIPIPFNSNLDRYNIPTEDKTELKKQNQLLPHRSYIRSRIANSLLFSWGTSTSSFEGVDFVPVYEARFNYGIGLYQYNYNMMNTKSGVVDHWLTSTLSYTFSPSRGSKGLPYKDLQWGGNYVADWWVSDTRFIGFYTYMEGGIAWYDGTTRLAISPAVGIQLGSLLGLKLYEWPAWTRIPVQLLLPLKVRAGADYVARMKPNYSFFLEIDILF